MNYRNELIAAKRSEGVLSILLALAFATFAFTSDGWGTAVDVTLAIIFAGFAFMDFRRARQIRKEA